MLHSLVAWRWFRPQTQTQLKELGSNYANQTIIVPCIKKTILVTNWSTYIFTLVWKVKIGYTKFMILYLTKALPRLQVI